MKIITESVVNGCLKQRKNLQSSICYKLLIKDHIKGPELEPGKNSTFLKKFTILFIQGESVGQRERESQIDSPLRTEPNVSFNT